MTFRPLCFVVCAVLFAGTAASVSAAKSTETSQRAPASAKIWTSTREARAIRVSPKGTVWVATTGGVLRFDGTTWRKFTRRDGLPSHEVLDIVLHGNTVTAILPTARATWTTRQTWDMVPKETVRKVNPAVQWRGAPATADMNGIHWRGKRIPMPSSTGTHISALLVDGPVLVAALYGDSLWRLEETTAGRFTWRREARPVPAEAREVTALAGTAANLWVGTRRNGLFHRRAGGWKHHLHPGEPAQHNAQALLAFGGAVWMSTLEDGLVARTADGWKQFGEPIISSNAPRHLVAFRDTLFVRHGGGMVDTFNGTNWTKNAFAALPRKGVYALAADAERLFCAGCGGWSEWDDTTWVHHYDIAELQGIPLMTILPDGASVWVGTQSRGVGLWNRQSGRFRWLDERHGLGDDWITTLAKVGRSIYAGTFVDGLAEFQGSQFNTFKLLAGDNVTALEPDGRDALWVGTRRGLWHLGPLGLSKAAVTWLDDEVQAVAATPDGVWIGTRTSLNFCSRDSLLPPAATTSG